MFQLSIPVTPKRRDHVTAVASEVAGATVVPLGRNIGKFARHLRETHANRVEQVAVNRQVKAQERFEAELQAFAGAQPEGLSVEVSS